MKFVYGHIAARSLAGCCIACVILAACIQGARGGEIDFLVPGVNLEDISFVPGTKVTYLTISHAYGTSDTSVVELSVLEYLDGTARLEITSMPYPPAAEEAVTVRLALSDSVKLSSTTDDVFRYIGRIEIREGAGPFREPTREEIDDFGVERLFIRSRGEFERVPREPETIETPAGVFACRVDEMSRFSSRKVKMGGIDAERREEERTVLWLSAEVPFWGLVRSTVERVASTEILSGKRAPKLLPRRSVTESVLFAVEPGR